MKLKLTISIALALLLSLFVFNVLGARLNDDTVYASHVTVTCTSSSVTYTGDPQTPCSATYTTDDGGSGTLDVNYSSNTDVGTVTASATYPEDATHTSSTDSKTFDITPASSSVAVSCSGVTYTGNAQFSDCYATASGAGGLSVDVSASMSFSNNTNAGTATVDASFAGDLDHSSSNGSGTFSIGKAAPDCSLVAGYSVTYDGATHTATGPCIGVQHETLSGLNLNGTSHSTAGIYIADPWSFSDTSGNYTNTSGNVDDVIGKATPTCFITPYNLTYDGSSHTAVGSCTGVHSEPLSGLVLVGTTHTEAGDYTGDSWTFSNTNYTDAGSGIEDIINQATVTCTINGYSGVYDGSAHGATGDCKSADGVTLSGLDLGLQFTDVPGDTADWAFSNASVTNAPSGSVDITITQAPSTVTVSCPASVTYNGTAQTPCTAKATGAGGLEVTGLPVTYGNNTNVGTATADASWGGDTDHTGSSGTGGFTILSVDPICSVTPYTSIYSGSPFTATGTCTGALGETLSGLDLSATTQTDAGDYPADPWTFHDATGNYHNASGTVHDSIAKASANCSTFVPYDVTYDGNAHTATGFCTGFGGVPLTGLDLTGTTHTNAADYPNDPWVLNNLNYSGSGTLHDTIELANADCTSISGYTGVYDGVAHGASGSCVDSHGVTIASGLSLGANFPNVPGGTAFWDFTNSNFFNQSGSVLITITPADATCSVTPYTVTYNGAAHTAATNCTGVGGTNLASSVTLSGTTHTLANDYPADPWNFSNNNYNPQSGTVHDIINKRAATVTAQPKTKIYEAADPPFPWWTTSNFAAVDVPLITFSASRAPGENVGTYLITPLATGAPVANYTITYVTANFTITKANPNCSITGYTVNYDASPHTATGSCLGPLGETLSGLDLNSTTNTLPGDYTDPWTFTDSTGNFNNANNTVHDVINYLAPTCTVTPYNIPYDTFAHSPTYVCAGSGGPLTGTFTVPSRTSAGTFTDNWTFTSTDLTYQATGTVTDIITPAPTVTTLTCTPDPSVYTGAQIRVCTAQTTMTDGGAIVQTVAMTAQTTTAYSYTNNLNVGAATATYTYAATTNFQTSTGNGGFAISQAPSVVTVTCPASVGYSGSAQTPCSAFVTLVGSPNLVLPVTYTNNIAQGSTATADASYPGDSNHLPGTGHTTFQITGVTLNCSVTAYSVTYNAAAHSATGTCTTSDGVDFSSGLNLVGTTHTDAGTYNADSWSFHDSTGTWPDQNGTVNDSIARADANCDANGFSFYLGPYTATPHGGAAHCYGVGGVDLSSLITYSSPAATNVGLAFINWTFNAGFVNPNYNTQTGYGIVLIQQANSNTTVNCAIAGFTGPYDGLPHGASGTCTGANNEDLTSSVTLGSKYTNAPGGVAHWTFTNSNYSPNLSGQVNINIGQIPVVVTITCPASVVYTGSAQTPCTAKATGLGGLNVTLPVTYGNNTNVGTASASATFAGDTNHLSGSNSVNFAITAIAPSCSVTHYSLPYDGLSHTATGSCTGVNGETLAGLDLSATTHTDAGSYNDAWTFSDSAGNYSAASGSVSDTITKLTATCTVNNYSVTYDGNSHTATGACTGLGGATLSGLVLTGTTHTDAGSYTDPWTFTEPSGNYNTAGGNVSDKIAKADADCTVTGYTVNYDGNAHTASASCTGVGGASLSPDLAGTTHTDAGDYPSDAWSFTDPDGNYNSLSGTVHDRIAMVNATIIVTGFTGSYDGLPHGATGSATGVNGEDLGSLLHLGATYTNIPGGTANWTFDGNVNYNPDSGSVDIVINKADATCVVTPYSVDYDGASHTATGSCTSSSGGASLSGLNLTATTHTDAGDYTDDWTFTDPSGNFTSQSGSVADTIARVDANCAITPYAVPYDGAAHTAGGSCTGVGGVSLTVDLTGTTHTTAGEYDDTWSLTDPNYTTAGDTIHDSITRLTAACTITPYTVSYDGNLHTAGGACIGLGGILDGLVLTGTTHTDAGDYPADAWTFTNPNYTYASGSLHDIINRADPVCTITPYSVPYNGSPHTATGACLGAKGETLAGLVLDGTTHINPGNYPNDAWTFTDHVTGNYNSTSGTVLDVIGDADPVCTVTPYSVSFDGSVHAATGTCTGVGGVTLTGLVLGATAHTNAGDYPADAWTFTDASGNYNNASGTVHDRIARADVNCTFTPYTVNYDSNPHTATGYCLGVGGVSLNGLTLGGTTHTNAGDYPTDAWTFTDATGNYNNATGALHDSIARINANCSVTPYDLTYDGSSHTATGSCTGIGGAALTGLDLSGTVHTGAGDFPNDPWVLNNTNYSANGSVHDILNQAVATCVVNGFTGVYDGAAHGAAGSCKTAAGQTLTGLDLGTKFTNVPGGIATWSFSNPNVRNSLNGNVNITITKAPSTLTVTCPENVTFTGASQEPCSAAAQGAGSLNQTLAVTYSNNINIGTATASASFDGDANHTGSTGSQTFSIVSETVAGVPLISTGTPNANPKGESGVAIDQKAPSLANDLQATPTQVSALATPTKSTVDSSLNVKVKGKPNKFWSTYSGLFGCIATGFLGMLIFFMFRRRKETESEDK